MEFMVVVAIMGTLAAIAIPAYNEYRKSAKKTAYQSDIQSLYKGWNAFSVELDSYCERETSPQDAGFANVGMSTLLTSKLYGNRNAAASQADCDVSGTSTPANLRPTGCSRTGGATACTSCSTGTFAPYIPAGNGPGKANFIGFGAETCPNLSGVTEGNTILRDVSATTDTHCTIGPTGFNMGVFGYVGGLDFISYSIADTGVLTENAGAPTQSWILAANFGHTCI